MKIECAKNSSIRETKTLFAVSFLLRFAALLQPSRNQSFVDFAILRLLRLTFACLAFKLISICFLLLFAESQSKRATIERCAVERRAKSSRLELARQMQIRELLCTTRSANKQNSTQSLVSCALFASSN